MKCNKLLKHYIVLVLSGVGLAGNCLHVHTASWIAQSSSGDDTRAAMGTRRVQQNLFPKNGHATKHCLNVVYV